MTPSTSSPHASPDGVHPVPAGSLRGSDLDDPRVLEKAWQHDIGPVRDPLVFLGITEPDSARHAIVNPRRLSEFRRERRHEVFWKVGSVTFVVVAVRCDMYLRRIVVCRWCFIHPPGER